MLLEAGAPVDVRNNRGDTPILLAIGQDNVEVVRLLTKAGGPLDWRYGDRDNTLLHYAANGGAPGIVKVLLEGGAEPNVRNARGETPLHLAAASAHNPTGVEAVRLLLDAGASVDAEDNRGRTALDSAEQNLEAWRLINDWEGS